MQYLRIAAVFVALVGLTFTSIGCESGGSEASGATGSVEGSESEAGGMENPDYHYSSFGIRLEAEEFDLMSFKDVGLGREDPEPSGTLLEALAQAVAYEFQVSSGLDVKPRVVHEPSLADPDEHTYCEKGRVYVDVWRSEGPNRWGYSMWSGCSVSQKFASREVRMETVPERTEPEKALKPLAEGIVESFSSAVDSGCYRRTC